MKYFKRNQSGLSLVEILVALVISLFLLGGIVQVFVGNKTTYRFSDASARVQENGRFALDTLVTDLRMAGFTGCYSLFEDDNDDGSLSDDNPFYFNWLNFTPGGQFDFIDEPPVNATNTAGDWTVPDTLTIRGARASQSTLTANLTLSNPITVAANNNFQVNDIALVTNCFSANIFQISSISPDGTTIGHAASGTPGNSSSSFRTSVPVSAYQANSASVMALQEVVYSIGVSGSGSGEPALFRSVNGGNNDELIEGIENMQVLFGVDTDNDGSANQYLEVDAVPDMQLVTAIRLWLVVRSDQDFIVDTSQTYAINGNNTTPADQRFRQVFSTTITLRSRAG